VTLDVEEDAYPQAEEDHGQGEHPSDGGEDEDGGKDYQHEQYREEWPEFYELFSSHNRFLENNSSSGH